MPGQTSWAIRSYTANNHSSGNHPVQYNGGGGSDGGGMSLARAQVPHRHAGILKNLSVWFRLEQFVADYAVHINGADSALSVRSTGPDGFYTDTTTRQVVSPGDLISFRASFVSGSGTNSYSSSHYEFSPDGEPTVTFLYAKNTFFATTLQNNSQVEQDAVVGLLADIGAAHDNRIITRPQTGGRWQTCMVYCDPNTRVTDSEVHNRIDNVKASILVTITAGMTGQFEDSTSEDVVTAGQAMTWGLENFTGGGNWRAEGLMSVFERDVKCWDMQPRNSGDNQNDNTITDNPYGGGWGSIFAGNFASNLVGSSQNFRRHDVQISANSLGTDSYTWMRVDSSNEGSSPSLVTVPAGMTGDFTSRDQQKVNPGQIVVCRRNTPFSAGAISHRFMQCEESPEVAHATDISWSLPIVHTEGGARGGS